MRYLNFMTDTDGSPIVYLLKALGVVVVGTIALTLVMLIMFPPAEDVAATDPASVPLFGLLIAWPIVSTLFIWFILANTRRIAPTYWHAAAGVALIIAIVFSLIAGIDTAVVVAWPFFIYSLTFLAWQLKSNLYGFGMCAALQGLVNLLPALILA
jgi:hypothetical protein